MKATLINIGNHAQEKFYIKQVCQPYLSTPFHFHSQCELVLIEESSGQRIIGDNIAKFEAGDLVFMSPNLPHIWLNDAIYHRRLKDPLMARATVIYFQADLLAQFEDDAGDGRPLKELLEQGRRGMHIYGETNRQITRLLAEIKSTTGLRRWILFIEILELLCHTTQKHLLASVGYSHQLDEKDTSRFNNVYQYLLHHYNRPITLGEVAAIANMSLGAFCRYFKSRTQKSVVEFIHELRIAHACKLLADKEQSIAYVCYDSGFQNLSNFNRIFKKITHKTPLEYRKALSQSMKALEL